MILTPANDKTQVGHSEKTIIRRERGALSLRRVFLWENGFAEKLDVILSEAKNLSPVRGSETLTPGESGITMTKSVAFRQSIGE